LKIDQTRSNKLTSLFQANRELRWSKIFTSLHQQKN
jgi:hypothetical protein